MNYNFIDAICSDDS